MKTGFIRAWLPSRRRGQNTVEYLLSLAVVVGVVMVIGVAFKGYMPSLTGRITTRIGCAVDSLTGSSGHCQVSDSETSGWSRDQGGGSSGSSGGSGKGGSGSSSGGAASGSGTGASGGSAVGNASAAAGGSGGGSSGNSGWKWGGKSASGGGAAGPYTAGAGGGSSGGYSSSSGGTSGTRSAASGGGTAAQYSSGAGGSSVRSGDSGGRVNGGSLASAGGGSVASAGTAGSGGAAGVSARGSRGAERTGSLTGRDSASGGYSAAGGSGVGTSAAGTAAAAGGSGGTSAGGTSGHASGKGGSGGAVGQSGAGGTGAAAGAGQNAASSGSAAKKGSAGGASGLPASDAVNAAGLGKDYAANPAFENPEDMKLEYLDVQGELFVAGGGDAAGADPSDVNQGALGDCYYLSSLAAIARQDPDFIAQAIRRNEDGSYSADFYRKKSWWQFWKPEYSKVTVTVDGKFPMERKEVQGLPFLGTDGKLHESGKVTVTNTAFAGYGDSGGGGNELWVMAMEKTYAEFRGSYTEIGEGGHSASALEELTGKKSTCSGASDITLAQIAEWDKQGYAITMGTLKEPPNKDVVGGHAYYLKSVDTEKGTITLGNPWGFNHVTLTEEEFQQNYRHVDINPIK